jgi:CheY-like chemotaxis protein
LSNSLLSWTWSPDGWILLSLPDLVGDMSISFTFPNNPSQLNGLRVLVVDDNIDSLFLLKAILQEYDIQVSTAVSVEQALEAIAQNQPDVLISDIIMPIEDGYDLIGKVRNLPPEQGGLIPAIALTAGDIEQGRAMAIAAGFQIYECKPIDPDALMAAIALVAFSNEAHQPLEEVFS